jgi:retinol-binding protein 3
MHRAGIGAIVAAMAIVGAVNDPAALQGSPSQADPRIDATERAEVIEGVLKHLDSTYVFVDMAKRMRDAVTALVAKKAYDTITSATEFAQQLTTDLQAVSNDKHLRVSYSAEVIPERRTEPTAEQRARFLDDARHGNHGFNKVERLHGNVGLLQLFAFSGLPEAGATAVAAMNFLANADALIIDVRHNTGGSPAMIGLITSYLFDDRIHLNDFYYRPRDETQQFWTWPYVEGKRFGQKKLVYVLTSSRTLSAAEEFAYDLKTLKRATIVGETTAGGAHAGGPRRINDHFSVWVPSSRAVNPITKTNWEGTGVEPDIKTEAAVALKTAHLDALRKLRAAETDTSRQEALDRSIAVVQKELDAMKGPTKTPRQ